MSDDWLADLIITTCEWVKECEYRIGAAHMCLLSGAEHELEYYTTCAPSVATRCDCT